MPVQRHSYPELLYFFDGFGKLTLYFATDVQSFDCSTGDCVIVPAETPHTLVDAPEVPLSLFGLAIDPLKFPVSQPLAYLLPAGKLPREQVKLLKVESRIRRLLFLMSEDNQLATLSAAAEAMHLLAGVAERNPQSTERPSQHDGLSAYIQWLSVNFYESLNLDQAATACNMSRRKFTTTFKERTGLTWLNYVQHLRIQHAIHLLEETNAKVTSIAFQTGFNELSTFYRVFKRQTGQHPTEFRRHNNG